MKVVLAGMELRPETVKNALNVADPDFCKMELGELVDIGYEVKASYHNGTLVLEGKTQQVLYTLHDLEEAVQPKCAYCGSTNIVRVGADGACCQRCL